ncbi:MAG TPA: response regulator [Candidatus Omnitrophota bacterium]|nr:response regulator [Candidatus Omnitrophota bacterium]
MLYNTRIVMTGTKVMVVDDDKDFLDELGETLSLSGYEMITVNDPSKVLNKASEVQPDVILLDLKMPLVSGFELAAEMKYFPEICGIPIIAISGFFKDEYSPLINMCGIKKCLKKPFSPLDVILVIEEVLHSK